MLYKKINAFTNGSSPGNPAGVVHLDESNRLTDAQMQEVARQEKGVVSEVVFCRLVRPGLYNLKYYSSECEVDFCGHGTIACMYDLISSDTSLAETETVMICTNKGELPVLNRIRHANAVFVTAPAPQFYPVHNSKQDIADPLRITAGQLDFGSPAAIIDGGLRTLIVPMISLKSVLDLNPDCAGLADFCRSRDIDIVLVFSQETALPHSRFRTRVFAPKYGYLEDPATGSGNSALGYYLLDNKLWDGGNIIALEQGPSRENPNIVKIGTANYTGNRHVIFGGSAAVEYLKEI